MTMRNKLKNHLDKCLILIFICLTHGLTYGQQSEWIRYFHRGVEAHYIQVSEKIFASQIETRNLDYKRFLHSLKESGDMDKYYKSLPDSSGWIDKVDYPFGKKYFEHYNSSKDFDGYPVVNISIEAMNWYCEWLTDIYKSNGKKYDSIIVRLPSETEWEEIANPNKNSNLPWNSKTAFKACKKKNCTDSCLTANIKVRNELSQQDSVGIFGTGVVESVSVIPMKGIDYYDIIGNVSEMTSDEKPKGGSWDNYLHECYIDKSQDYQAPDPRLGFRVIVEILE